MKKISDISWDMIACGLPKNHDLEVLRKLVLLNLIFGIGGLILICFSILAFTQNNIILFSVDLFVGILSVLLLLWLRKSQNFSYANYAGMFIVFSFYLFLVANGGVNNSAFVWSFTSPLIAVFLLGGKNGVIASLIYLLILGSIFILGSQISYIARYPSDLIIRSVMGFCTITLFSFAIEKTREMVQIKLTQSNIDLQKTLEDVEVLSGLLPICSSCKNIRDDNGYWNQIDSYISSHSQTEFTHSICPDCAKKLYPDLDIFEEK